jgi:hypothetical protein
VTSYKHILHGKFSTTFNPSAPWFINKENVLVLPFQTVNNSHGKTQNEKGKLAIAAKVARIMINNICTFSTMVNKQQ